MHMINELNKACISLMLNFLVMALNSPAESPKTVDTSLARGIAIQIDHVVCSFGCLFHKPRSWILPWLEVSPHDSGYHQNRVATQFMKTGK
jgi:hypothetical protein